MVFNDMIADIFSNKTLSAIVAELFIRGRKLNILSCCYYKILFCCTKKILC